ncbi:MAG: glycosyltransferase family 4 protein [Candidatus Omnitrophica bacterium]|nr:glycosyltransferase family 4 protein [Candidatus Omnitrophota bacterium]
MARKKNGKKVFSRKINIAQLHWGFPPIIGGVETHLTIIMPEMVKRGHRVSLLTGSVEGSKLVDSYKGVKIYRTPLMDLNWLAKRGVSGLEGDVGKALSNFFDKVKPDIIHAHNMHYFSKPHTEVLEKYAGKHRIPLILTAHNVWDDLMFLDLTRNVKWNHIIAVSHFIKRELMGAGIDDRKITVIHHGIDTKIYRPNINTDKILKAYPQLKGKRVIFHPARMGLAKGCDVSIKALNLVKQRFPDVMLVLAGTKNIIDWGGTHQKDIAYMVNLVKIFNLEKNVLIDSFTLDEVAELYGVAKVCMYPSSSGEPFGLTMLESLSSAKPIIVTDSGGMPEIIQDGITGYVIPIKDFEVLASRIIQVLSDDRLRNRLGYTGRQIVEKSYSKETVTKATLHVYRNAMKRLKLLL